MSALVLLAMLAAAHGLYTSSGPVLSLTNKNFKSEILESALPALVEFYAPWSVFLLAPFPSTRLFSVQPA